MGSPKDSLSEREKRGVERLPSELSFYDVKSKRSFKSSAYKVVKKKGIRFAVAKSPFSKIDSYRILGR